MKQLVGPPSSHFTRVCKCLLVVLCILLAGADSVYSHDESHDTHLPHCAHLKDKNGFEYSSILPPIDEDIQPMSILSDGPLYSLSVPIYHSKPNATKKIFLDFDGHIVPSNNIWSSNFNNGNPIHAPPYSTDSDLFSFSQSELNNIEQIWKRVAEDFAPYEVDVTTEDPGLAAFQAGNLAIRVLISTDIDDESMGGTGNQWSNFGGGVAYINSWYWTSDTPVWGFRNRLGNGNPKYVGEVVSHEVGHALGLYHDGNNSTEYYGGHGSGDTSWAPIMGVGYYRPLTQWSKGEYPNANNTEDDLHKIANGFGYSADDHGGTIQTASALGVQNGTQITATGIIRTENDVDMFSFTTGAGEVTINALPFEYPTKGYANLDILMRLYDHQGDLLASANPVNLLEASITTNLASGTYYVSIEGTGKPTDYSAYASLGYYRISGTIQESSGDGGGGDGDTTRPTAQVETANNITASGIQNYNFTIRYTDNVAVLHASLDSQDIQVTGPAGYSQFAQFISSNPSHNSAEILAEYRISSPSSSWNYLHNGVYSIQVRPNQVYDTSNNSVQGGTLGTFSVAVHEAPYIVTHPDSKSVADGEVATFSCTAGGEGPLSYQWFRGASAISGATGSLYSFITALDDHNSTYRCRVSNSYGQVFSNIATLGVQDSSTFSVGGAVRLNGTPLSGINMQHVGVNSKSTNSEGLYSFTGLVDGLNYTIRPVQAGYVFSPDSRSGTINGSSVQNADFSATCASGYIVHDGRCVLNVPAPPENLEITRGTYSDKVDLVWKASIGASIYNIYRVQLSGGVIQKIGTGNTTSFRDLGTNATTKYVYYVSAQNSNGEGPKTAGVEGWRADPFVLDYDGDGMTDGEELLRGSNPYDRGSVQRLLRGSVCSGWNGFLPLTLQINEVANQSSYSLSTALKVYSIDGIQQSTLPSLIPGKGKFDFLVHDLQGFVSNSYGRVCFDVASSAIVDGGMTFYKYPEQSPGVLEPSFAFMAPFLPPIPGSQYVGINTYQPSLRYDHQDNLVANWIEITNASTSHVLSGDLIFYLSGFGEPVCTRRVNLDPSQRFDTPAHSPLAGDAQGSCSLLGPFQVGFVEWRPRPGFEKVAATVRNVRYIFDNPFGFSSYDTAFQLQAEVGTGEAVFAPVDTRGATSVLEVLNVKGVSQTISVEIFKQNGSLAGNLSASFGPYESRHFVLDGILEQSLGVARVQGALPESTLAVVMQYGRNPDASIKWMYGLLASEAFGGSLGGSFNSFMDQDCSFVTLNTTPQQTAVNISLLDPDGKSLLFRENEIIPPFGIREFSCDPGIKNQYGSISVTSQKNTVIGTVIRKGVRDIYRFPTPLRSNE